MSERTFQWFETEPPPGKRAPKWALTTGLASDGTVWLPAVVLGSEMEVFLCASFDGTPLVSLKGHAFVESEWAKREFKKSAHVVTRIEERTRAAAPSPSSSPTRPRS